MSNVLIGIIGVILFIGLALAGALFLGPRFQESTNNSKASAAVQAVSQVASAANMYNVQEGKTATSIADLTGGNYLKSVPGNPMSGTGAAAPTFTQVTTGPTDAQGTYITMNLGAGSGAVCEAIARQSGQLSATVTAPPTAVDGRPSGCFTTGTGASLVGNAFARV